MGINLRQAGSTANPAQAEQVFLSVQRALKGTHALSSQKEVDGLLSVLGNSNFLARWAERFPEKVANILEENLEVSWDEKMYHHSLQTSLSREEEVPQGKFLSLLLDLKYKQFFRITFRDLGLGKPFQEISSEISCLAKTILQAALDWYLKILGVELGFPKRESAPTKQIPFAILAMGKLGGQELNYSSDVDLIYLYGSDEGKVIKAGKNSALTPHEFFTKLCEKLTRFLSQKTAEGFLFRVDLELRPEGKSGTLSNSIDAMEDYYETFGAYWEKQAMIKASLAAGSRPLFLDFMKRMNAFIYPKSADFRFLSELKIMKKRILESVQKTSEQGFHVKLGKGGIREIEFFIQSLQFLFGGKIPALQTPNTLKAIQRIFEAKLITKKEKINLENAYIFLRTLENRLQQVEEQQTHRLPEDREALCQMARRMGFREKNPEDATNRLLENLENHRIFVQETFDSLLSKRYEE